MWTPKDEAQALREERAGILTGWQSAARTRLWHLDGTLFTRKGAATRAANVTLVVLIDLCQGRHSDRLVLPADHPAPVGEATLAVLDSDSFPDDLPDATQQPLSTDFNTQAPPQQPDGEEPPDLDSSADQPADWNPDGAEKGTNPAPDCSPRSALETIVRPAAEAWIALPCGWSDTRVMLEILAERARSAFLTQGADAETMLRIDSVLAAVAALLADDRIRTVEREFAAHRQDFSVTQHMAGRFLANASHELRTPLTAILGFADLLLEETFGPIDEAQRTAISHIENSAQNLLEVINNLLDMLRIRSGKITLQHRQVAVAPLIDAIYDILTPLSGRKSVGFTKEVDGDLGTIEADESILRHIIYNLLASALRATPAGGEVRLLAERKGGELVVTTHDTALHLPPEALANMSDIFPKLENSPARGYEGWEAGLPLVRRYVELHDGSLTLQSEPGGGTTFQVRIPIARHPSRSAGA
jgi:signal transduction histidine kinase